MTATDTPAADAASRTARIVAIVGPVVDVEFPPDGLPELNHALEFDIDDRGRDRPPSPPRSPSTSATAGCGPSP